VHVCGRTMHTSRLARLVYIRVWAVSTVCVTSTSPAHGLHHGVDDHLVVDREVVLRRAGLFRQQLPVQVQLPGESKRLVIKARWPSRLNN
jgi:hypothetical protein